MLSLYWLIGFLLPTQLGKYWFFEWSYVGGIPVDYLSLKFFLSEVVIFVAGLWIIVTDRVRISSRTTSFFAFFLLIFVFFSQDRAVSMGYALGLLSSFAVVFVVYRAKGEGMNALIKGIVLMGFVQLFLVIYQLVIGRNFGGAGYWLGERELSFGISNVARYAFGGIERLRPYGTFSHPNSLAGFSFVVFWLCYMRLKDARWKAIGMTIWFLCGILSLSKAGVFAFLVSLVVYKWGLRLRWVFLFLVLISMLTLGLSVSGEVVKSRTVEERLMYARTAIEVSKNHPIFGSGIGNFIPTAFEASSEYARRYSYQPIHNVLLLSLSELGLVGFSVVVFAFKRHARNYKIDNYSGVVSLILISGAFDHYWLTLLQNKLIIAVVIGILLRENSKKLWKTVN